MSSAASKAPTPRLRIRRATPDDAPTIAKIHFEAFGPGVMTRLMHPGGVTESARASFAGTIFPPPGHAGTIFTPPEQAPDPSSEVLVMVAELLPEGDEGSGDQGPVMVAYAKWRLVREAQPREKWEGVHELTDEDLGEGSDASVYNVFVGGMHQMKKR